MNAVTDRYREFVRGIALAMDLTYSQAVEQWSSYSRQLSNTERERIESQGQDSGFEMGNEILHLP